MKKIFFVFILSFMFSACTEDDRVNDHERNQIEYAVIDYLRNSNQPDYSEYNVSFTGYEVLPSKFEKSDTYRQMMELIYDAQSDIEKMQLESYLESIRLKYSNIKYSVTAVFTNGNRIDNILYVLDENYYIIRGYRIWYNYD